jgi:hypothetical protein
MPGNRIDALLDPAFLEGLRQLPLSDIRARRKECSEIEVGLSYFRRLVQGRLDIVLEVAHRREVGEPADAASLVAHLPEILSDHLHSEGNGRLPFLLAPAEQDQVLIDRMDAIVDVDRLSALPRLTEEELGGIVEALSWLEREASTTRRSLHDVMDRLQEELVRRYKSGEASVDSLLSPPSTSSTSSPA